MTLPRLLFVSYYSLHPVGLIGVAKRCLRLISGLPEHYEIFLVSFGDIPPEDPVFKSVAHRINILATPNSRQAIATLLERIKPAVIIFGECPIRGMMLETYRAATRAGLYQMAIDNYYGRPLARLLQAYFFHIRQWLLLGIVSGPQRTASHWGLEVVPPLIRLPARSVSATRDRIVINGYHPRTLVMAYECLKALPGRERVDFFLPKRSTTSVLDLPFKELPHEFHFREAVGDAELVESVSQAKVVLGKAGFQQIVESALLGTPVVCQMYNSGVFPFMVPSHLRKQVKLVWSMRGLRRAMPRIRTWVRQPVPSFTVDPEKGATDFVQLAAGRLDALIRTALDKVST